MKLLLALLVGAGTLVSGPASPGAPAAEVRHTQIAGRDYVRLTVWAAANGPPVAFFRFRQLRRPAVQRRKYVALLSGRL
jgi:hypothetical protein